MLLPVQECGKGVNKDLLPSELLPGVWSDSSNMRFRNGFAERRKGISAVYTTPTAVPYWIGTYSTSTTRFCVQLGTATAFVDDGSTRTEITGTPPTGTRDDRWTGGDFNGVFFCNNGVDDPMYWNGDVLTNLATITAWTAGEKADAMRAFKNYLFAMSITKAGTKYPYRLRWSNAADPGALPSAWTASATNDAGEQDLVGAGHLVDALQLGDALIVYGQEGRYAVRYIGGNDVFSFQQLPGKDGLLARGCVVNTPRGHVFLTNGDVRLHSGGESVSIADGIVRKWMTATMDGPNSVRSFLVLNPQETEVWVVFPAAGSSDCDTVLAWNWTSAAGEGWSVFTVPNLTYAASGLISSSLGATYTYATVPAALTYDTATSTYGQNEASSNEARLLVATSSPLIGLANTGSQDFGTRISWFLEKTGIPLSAQADSLRSVSRLRPNLDAASGAVVLVKVTTTKAPDEFAAFSASTNYTQGTTTDVNQFTKAGRYGAVRIEGTDDQLVAMRSYRLEVTDAGGRF
jgi:hypothetical protein